MTSQVFNLKLPLYIHIGKYKVKKVSLNLNWYRNAHYIVSNNVKKIFYESLLDDLAKLPKMENIKLIYEIYLPNKRKTDIMNIGSIVDKFFCDALVNAKIIPDDSYEYIKEITFKYSGIDKHNPCCIVNIVPLNDIFE